MLQDQIGFPYLSPTCYWYLVKGSEAALGHVTLKDVGEDVEDMLTRV
jgi:hypothetical protein